MIRLFLSLFLVSTAGLHTGTAAEVTRPLQPNVILILADDLGWQDVKCYDLDEPSPVETPNIDNLAKQGVLFWQAYSPAPTCSPTRVAIMTGEHPARNNRTHVIGGSPPSPYNKAQHRMMPPYYKGRMEVDEVTLPKVLREHGYATGHCGKWHMAIDHHAYPQPEDQGFDWTRSNLGATRRMQPDRMTGFATDAANDPYRLDENGFPYHQNSEDAMEFIRGHSDQPFFLYYATWLVHTPIHTRSKQLLDKYVAKLGVQLPEHPEEWHGEGQTNPFYLAMVEELDYHMGRLFEYLEATDDPRWPGHKLSENTYIIVTSDNGGMERVPNQNITDNYPLDRGKISAMEGGTRVPLILRGPQIPAGVESDVMVNGLDFYPTILTLAGIDKPEGRILDGVDLTQLLLQDPTDASLVKTDAGAIRDTMLWHFPNSIALESTLRIGDWKLIRNYDYVNNQQSPDRYELYRLYDSTDGEMQRVDIEEAHNLAAEFPQRVESMDARLSELLTEMDARYPHYNAAFKGPLPHKDEVPTVVSHERDDSVVTFVYKTNGALVERADLIYTLNGGERYEEWFQLPATLGGGNQVIAELPEGATHYVINLMDENNFLVSYPEMMEMRLKKRKNLYSTNALSVD
ncbi:MAG TPA: N-acetylgalactosamine-6-sulfatase [Opitutae bacterium]|nr:N-acetylgalactosamine-6-sulfatase [Opitutae bacterium]